MGLFLCIRPNCVSAGAIIMGGSLLLHRRIEPLVVGHAHCVQQRSEDERPAHEQQLADAEGRAALSDDRAAALEAEVEGVTKRASTERANAAALEAALKSERQILRSMSVLMKNRLAELAGERGGGVAQAAVELQAVLARCAALEEQMGAKEQMVARLCAPQA